MNFKKYCYSYYYDSEIYKYLLKFNDIPSFHYCFIRHIKSIEDFDKKMEEASKSYNSTLIDLCYLKSRNHITIYGIKKIKNTRHIELINWGQLINSCLISNNYEIMKFLYNNKYIKPCPTRYIDFSTYYYRNLNYIIY